MEANAEHDFRLKRLIGMYRTIERAQIFCAICQALPPDRPFDTRILYGKKVSSTLHEEPSVLSQFISFWRRNFLYGKKESCLPDSPPAAGRNSDILHLRRSAIIAFYHMIKRRYRCDTLFFPSLFPKFPFFIFYFPRVGRGIFRSVQGISCFRIELLQKFFRLMGKFVGYLDYQGHIMVAPVIPVP